MIVDFLVDLRILAAAAEAAKVEEQPDFARRLEIARQRTLMERFLVSEAAKQTDDASLQASYDEYVKAQPQQTEVRARHILIKDEEAAKKALERVKAGEDFAKLATELSSDPGSAKEGGDLGYFTKDRMVPNSAKRPSRWSRPDIGDRERASSASTSSSWRTNGP